MSDPSSYLLLLPSMIILSLSRLTYDFILSDEKGSQGYQPSLSMMQEESFTFSFSQVLKKNILIIKTSHIYWGINTFESKFLPI